MNAELFRPRHAPPPAGDTRQTRPLWFRERCNFEKAVVSDSRLALGIGVTVEFQ